jgi:cyclohexyl-isocyanide hydratase
MADAAPIQVNMLLFPNVTQLDLTGPYEVLARMPGAQVALVGASLDPVVSDRGLTILPTASIATALPADLLVVPGGPGTDDAILDPTWVRFVRRQAASARWIFGICTGSLLLGAAGLLRGRRSAGHWLARDLLAQFGATPCDDRMVIDGNVFTSGGVTAGIDMALKVVAAIHGDETARRIQLQIEYDPKPPFRSGTPFTASAETVAAQRQAGAARRLIREQAVTRAAAAMERG